MKVLRLEKEDSELLEMRRKALESLMKKTMKTKQLKAGLGKTLTCYFSRRGVVDTSVGGVGRHLVVRSGLVWSV